MWEREGVTCSKGLLVGLKPRPLRQVSRPYNMGCKLFLLSESLIYTFALNLRRSPPSSLTCTSQKTTYRGDEDRMNCDWLAW